MKRPYVIWGSGGHARVLHDALHTDWQLVALFDKRDVLAAIPGCPVYVGTEGLEQWHAEQTHGKSVSFAVAIGGSGSDRLDIQHRLQTLGLSPLTIQHASAIVAHDVQIGTGSHILAGAVIGANARLDAGVIVNTAASIDHDCVIGPGVHVAPGVRIAGNVTVGANAFLGIGSVILPWLTIGEGAVVGAGAVVTRNVPPHVKVVGVPAHPIHTRPT